MQKEYVVYDPIAGVSFKTTKKTLEKAQKILNEKMASGIDISYEAYMEILMKDWPEEKKKEFYEQREDKFLFRLDDLDNERVILFNNYTYTNDMRVILDFDSACILPKEGL